MSNLSVSDQRLFAERSAFRVALGDIAFAREHSLSHSADICATDILAAVHLAIGDHTLPRVGPVALLLDLLMIRFFLILVCLLAELHLL